VLVCKATSLALNRQTEKAKTQLSAAESACEQHATKQAHFDAKWPCSLRELELEPQLSIILKKEGQTLENEMTEARKLFEQVRIVDLLEELGWQATKPRGAQLRGSCPLPGCSRTTTLGSSSPSQWTFSVKRDRNIYSGMLVTSS